MAEESNSKKKYINLSSPEYYFNRELSLLEFNRRVLMEAQGNQHPLLERLKFLSILSSNLDEFFMIRVAGLKSQSTAGVVGLSFDGMTPEEQLVEIRKRLLPLYDLQEKILMEEIIPAMEGIGIFIHWPDDLTPEDKEYLDQYFNDCLLPVLTPLSLDPAHPFPRLINRSLNIAFVLQDNSKKFREKKAAFLQLPSVLPRFVKLKRDDGHHFVLLEQIVKDHAGILFPGLDILTSNTFRVTRDADIEIAEDEAEDLLTEIAEQIKHRKWGRAVVRMEVSSNMPEYLVDLLKKSLEVEHDDIYVHNRPLKLPDFMQLMDLDYRELKDKPFQTRIPPELKLETMNIFEAIRKNDIIVHHPYDSFTNSTLKLLQEASTDPKVVAIKITLYRTGINSPVVNALKRAAENGKDVTAFVELKARFDEENNIIWARELESNGAHVVYGILGLKTHCKIAMIVRREDESLRTYLHLSTGNYNYTTSRIYTDIGLLTADKAFAGEAIHLFNYLTGYSNHTQWKNLIVAPVTLRRQVIELINREVELHSPDNPGVIFAKMNSLAHAEVIQALYRASKKGVKVKLIVRGICCLKPSIEGISDNIEVRSVIGRFLEHSRIFYFKAGGKNEVYLSSADWMTRNLHKRVELMYPIKDKDLQKKLISMLDIYWRDNKKSWRLLPDGNYEKLQPSGEEELFSSQEYFLSEIKRKIKKSRQNVIPYI